MIKTLYKRISLIIILISLIISLFINNKKRNSIITPDNEFKKYQSYNPLYDKEYNEKYLVTNNYIYSLNLINHPSFLDLSINKRYIKVKELILVNPKYFLEKDFIPHNLVEVDLPHIKRTNEIMKLDENTLNNYRLMYLEAKEKGINLTVFSGYRTYEKQLNLYNNAKDITYIAKPGHSEHQTGLAIDISTLNNGLTTSFEKTSCFSFLQDNAYKYGFILRYPKGKEHLTGYSYEPWHFRYVGIKHSYIIYQENLTLEEYIYKYFEL